jgi:hypothetical protein
LLRPFLRARTVGLEYYLRLLLFAESNQKQPKDHNETAPEHGIPCEVKGPKPPVVCSIGVA